MPRIAIPSLALLLAGLASAADAPQQPTPDSPLAGVIAAGRLNVRLRPDTSAPVLGQLPRGTGVVVRRVAAGWCEIDLPRAFGVWIGEKLVLLEGDAATLGEGGSVEATVATVGARLRSTPSLRGAVLGECEKGAKLKVLRAFNGWLRVDAPGDIRAYAHADYVELRGPAGPETDTSAAGPDSPGAGASPAAEKATLPAGAPGAVPEPAEKRIALAEVMLSDGKCSLDETRRALRLLEEALSLEGLSDEERGRVRARVRAVLGGLGPSRWLELFDEAEALHRKDVEAVERSYAGPLRDARKALDEAAPLEHTARGTLLAPGPGSEAYRLVHGDTLLYEVDTGGRDLSAFVGRRVGVIGEVRAAARPGGAPVVAVTYVEEIDAGTPGTP